MPEISDFRSDTVTRPTPDMRHAMAEAEVGDDVLGDDPTVQRLEELAARSMGMEAALFVTSGTQGNLTAILAHTRAGDEVIVEEASHTYLSEAAGASAFGGVQLRSLAGRRGALSPEQVEAAVRDSDIHHPPTSLVILEQTHNFAGGAVIPLATVRGVAEVAHRHGLKLHIDGARVFNAAVALGVPAAEVVRGADSVTFCLSKGLGCPAGSLLAGSADFIALARRKRKMLGGGLRQVGVLAAPGLLALESRVERLAEDHANARLLAEGLADIPGVKIDVAGVETNIVFFAVPGRDLVALCAELENQGVRVFDIGERIRMVTHHDVRRADVKRALQAVHKVLEPARSPIPARA